MKPIFENKKIRNITLGLFAILVLFILSFIIFRKEIALSFNRAASEFYFSHTSPFSRSVWKFSVTNPLIDEYLKKEGLPANKISNNPVILFNNINQKNIKHKLRFVFIENSSPEKVIEFEKETVELEALPDGVTVVRDGINGKEIYSKQEIVQFVTAEISRREISNSLDKTILPLNEITYRGSASIEEINNILNNSLPELSFPIKIYKTEFFSEGAYFDENNKVDVLGRAAILVNDCNYYVWQPITLTNNLELQINLAENFTNYDCEIKQSYSEPVELIVCEDCTLATITKERRLHEAYVPKLASKEWNGVVVQFSSEAINDLISMLEAAKNAGHEINITSTYRSFADQVNTFEYWVLYNQELYGYDRQKAEEVANQISAKPGFSEHQLGTAVDLNTINCQAFEGYCQPNVDFWDWLKENAAKYNFYISYPEGQEATTGYSYEPWHYRWKPAVN